MAYREDDDLKFLEQLKSEDLNDLVYCLTKDKDGSARLTEELTTNDLYKEFNPDHHQYWKEIAAEIQCFGANSFMTMIRGGKGVLYKEILIDVCGKLKVKFDEHSCVDEIENCLLMKILSDSLKKMSAEELKQLADSLGLANADHITPEIMIGTFQAVFVAGGFLSYELALIVANSIAKAVFGRGLTLVGNATLTRTLAVLAGPVGWILTGIWTAVDIAGPAYRVTIPAVILIATLRKKRKRYSVALIGDVAVGKTTLLRYLQKGEFVQIDEHTCVEEKNQPFESPLWQRPIDSVIDPSGSPEFIKKQKELCKDKSLVLFCYNPQEIFKRDDAKSQFLQRLQGIENEKVFFIATHGDSYDISDMKERICNLFSSPSMGSYSKLFTTDNSFFVNLKNEIETKKMLSQILNIMEAYNHD